MEADDFEMRFSRGLIADRGSGRPSGNSGTVLRVDVYHPTLTSLASVQRHMRPNAT